jgi:hypothetical protein
MFFIWTCNNIYYLSWTAGIQIDICKDYIMLYLLFVCIFFVFRLVPNEDLWKSFFFFQTRIIFIKNKKGKRNQWRKKKEIGTLTFVDKLLILFVTLCFNCCTWFLSCFGAYLLLKLLRCCLSNTSGYFV